MKPRSYVRMVLGLPRAWPTSFGILSTTWIPTAGGEGDTPLPGLPSCQTANHFHLKESNMRRGSRRDDWNRFNQEQNTTLLACFNEQAAEAAVRKVALAAAAASARHRLTTLRRFGNTGIRTAGGGGGAVTLSRLPAASLVLLVANPQSDGSGAPPLGDHHHLYEHTLRADCIGS
jgi:hypothetical protein